MYTHPLSLPPNYQVNAVDTLGQTSLHRAALAGHIQTCRLLLGYGADPSIVSLQGFTAAQMGNEAVQQILNGKRWSRQWSGFICKSLLDRSVC